MITAYSSTETNFSHNGIAVLSPTSCTISEELNGAYELELVHPIDGLGRWKCLRAFNIIKAPSPKNGFQLFRIYQPGKIIEGGLKVNARHIFYDLIYNYIKSCSITGATGDEAIKGLLGAALCAHKFTGFSDITAGLDAAYENKNPVACIMDGEESLLNIYGGELLRDNYSIAIKQSIGEDKGVCVRYRKNLTGLEVTENVENTVTRLIPYLNGLKGNVYLPEIYVDSPKINLYPFPLVQSVEFTDLAEDENENVSSQLRERARQLFEDGIDEPEVNIKVEFVNLEKTEEYKDYAGLESVSLGDAVTVVHEGLDVSIKAKCISYVFNCLTNRYEKIELGQSKANLTETAFEADRGITKVSGVDLIARGIANDMGGHVLKRYDELLIMDAVSLNDARKIWKWDKDGLSYSRTGYGGTWYPYLKMDGTIGEIPAE